MISKIVQAPFKITRDARINFIALSDPRTPLVAKTLIILAFLYLLSPLDFIPDFIPIAGWVDDLLIFPALTLFSQKFIPLEILQDAQNRMSKMKRNFLIILAISFSLLLILIFKILS
jgi:uncharacterized membrane protein YkvA (DUF1232 family)